MQIFQRNILNKYIEGLDNTLIDERYKTFSSFFLDPERQANILNSKEEQFQEGFLRELFVKILGYTLNPDPNFNLTTEKRNETNSKKADGAILVDGKVVGVIELKDHKTPDLSKVEAQAFNYKSQHKEAVYVVISNFEKLRFYIDNAVDFEEFDLFHLTRDDFAHLWICLAYENIAKNLPKQIKAASLTNEDQITNALYKDYSNFKRDLFEDIIQHNPTDDTEQKILLFKKTQKLLDRLLFIFFAEDRSLLPPNSIMLIINQWEKLKDLDEYQPFYNRLKKYFGYMNTGFQGRNYEVFAYNGGLFKPDEILDGLIISDEVLMRYCKKISDYDFQSDVDVNILGHIFENSLTEIEEITTKLQQGEAPTISKRKKDGVFYTPQYITKYIVENTVGKLCREKKAELGIDESEYFTDKKRQLATKKALIEKLDAYRNWLLQISICDPACGSGAFLNAALNFLIAEHKLIDEMQAKVEGASLVFPNVENSILENNLYGVDINEESVEIAKLSLWLRTAKPHRKLNSLNNNIKCGNSLIDDPAIAGNKAFSWQAEFPKVFEKGGFDVVIGNPPYVRQELIQNQVPALKEYKVYTGKADLYTYFYERADSLLKPKGLLGFICSGKFFEANYGKVLVDFLFNHYRFIQVIDYDDLEVFKGVSAYPLIFIASKENNIAYGYDFKYCFVPSLAFNSLEETTQNIPFTIINSEVFHNSNYKFLSKQDAEIMEKISQEAVYLSDLGLTPLVGVKTGYNDGYITSNPTNEHIKPYIFGRNIKRYAPLTAELNIVFPYNSTDDGYSLVSTDCQELGLLLPFESKLKQRAIIKEGLFTGNKVWYEYQQINKKLDFSKEYIVYPNVSLGANFTLSKGSVVDMTGFIIPTNDKYLLAILNSSISMYVMNQIAITRRGGYQEYKAQYMNQIPIKVLDDSAKQPFSSLADQMLTLCCELQQKRQRFIHRLKENLGVQKITATLERFDVVDFKTVLAELKKQKISLSLTQQDEWEDYFTQYKADCNALTAQIAATDKEIDRMVYQLYGLTEDEISIIEKD